MDEKLIKSHKVSSMKIKELQINKSLSTPYGRKMAGSKVKIECDSNNIPISKFWRARLKDSKIDNCVEFFKSSKTNKNK